VSVLKELKVLCCSAILWYRLVLM